jgi:Cys-rich repeat protein
MSVFAGFGWFGFGVRWAAALAVVGSLMLGACGSDGAGSRAAVSGADAGDGGNNAEAGAGPGKPGGGDGGAVAPGDLVCQANSDCKGDKPVCDPVQGCVACIYDWDCPANDRCDGNQCFKKQACSTSNECANDAVHPVCDPIQNVCVGCRLDADCGAGQRCSAAKCEPVEPCVNSHGCSLGQVCDRGLGVCVACVSDGDCGPGTACVSNACVPQCKSDKECLGLGLLCDKPLGRCVECVSNADCPAAYFCGPSNVCLSDICQQGDMRCENAQTLGTCSLAGDQFVNASCAGNTTCSEHSAVAAACDPWLCTPNAVSCSADGGAVVTCSADGLSVKSTVPCGAAQACINDVCQDVICAPSVFSCQGSDLYQCNAQGTANAKVKTCGVNATCNATTGTCTPPACTAGAPMCDGNSTTLCAADGTGPAPGGTPCADGKACYAGACAAITCTGSFQCADGVLKKCTNNGTAFTSSNCNYAALCDAVAGKCLTPVCTPGAFACNGQVAARCKLDGSGYEPGGTDCAAQNLVCDGGGCLAKVCTPNTYFCNGGNVQSCSNTGATYITNDTCLSSEFCQTGSSNCLLDKCTAGAAVCNGNVATTCAADGSGPVSGGTDCSLNSQICLSGACKPVVCTKGSLSCVGEALYQCNDTGTGTNLFSTCSASAFCDTSGETATCTPDICSANSLGCIQEVISTCGANGGSWLNPGTNCAASNQVCSLGGTCAAQEVTVQGSGSVGSVFSNSSYVYATELAEFRVTTPRKLTLLEIDASVSGLQKFTWVVYQKRVNSSLYDLVYQSVTSQTAPLLGFIASPPLDYTFAVGKTYAIGVHIAGPFTLGYHSVGTAQAGFNTAAVAAGFAEGGAQPSTSIIPVVSPYYFAYLRFTTTLP